MSNIKSILFSSFIAGITLNNSSQAAQSRISSFNENLVYKYHTETISFQNSELKHCRTYQSAKFTYKFILWYNMCAHISNLMNQYKTVSQSDFYRNIPNLHQNMYIPPYNNTSDDLSSKTAQALLLVEKCIYNYEKSYNTDKFINLESLLRITINTMQDMYSFIHTNYGVKIYDFSAPSEYDRTGKTIARLFRDTSNPKSADNARKSFLEKFYQCLMSTNTNNKKSIENLRRWLGGKIYIN